MICLLYFPSECVFSWYGYVKENIVVMRKKNVVKMALYIFTCINHFFNWPYVRGLLHDVKWMTVTAPFKAAVCKPMAPSTIYYIATCPQP